MLQVLECGTPGIHVVQELEFYELNIVLDSGAAAHVVECQEAPAYIVSDRGGSNAGGCFVAPSRKQILNKGEMTLVLQSGDAAISSKFQSAQISRLLQSVGNMRCWMQSCI